MRDKAIRNTHPTAVTIFHGGNTYDANGEIVVLDESVIATEQARLQSEHDAQEYARNRQAEYPSLNELIVALWENVVEERAASVVSLEAKRQEIKTKYPK